LSSLALVPRRLIKQIELRLGIERRIEVAQIDAITLDVLLENVEVVAEE
jgi:hypothetical protein